ncbi:MAG: hypothetical protein R2822_17295 [Spirosomataceae bacterium]
MALDSWNDHYVNLVQWIAMLGSVFVIGLVGKQFGFGRKMQLFLSVMQLTLPIGILESTTTQNDYIANFLFLSFLYFGIVIIKQTRKEIFDYKSVGWMALALALGGFNKYTVLLFGFPICIWIGVELLKNLPLKYSIYTVLTALLLLIVVFTPFFKRNYDLFDNVLSSTKESPLFTEEVATERKCIGCVVSVTLKNLTGHLGLPVQSYNEAIDKAVAVFHQLIGIPLNTPELNVDDYYTRFGIQEDMSHNPWHFILICVGIVWLLFQKKHGNFKLLLLCAVVGFVLFSALIKYQIYNTRVIMPFFSMGFVWTGLMVNLWTNKWRNGLMVLFLLAGLPYLYTNYNKNLLPLRQWSKYVLGYIPPFLCVKEGQIEKYQNQFGAIYDFGKGTPCYPLKSSPNYIQRLSVVSQLQALGYYKNEEMAFWRKSREENYFTEMYDLGLYSDLKTIVAALIPKRKG